MAIIILSVLLLYFIANTVLTVKCGRAIEESFNLVINDTYGMSYKKYKICSVVTAIFAFIPAILSYLIVSKLLKKDSSES